MNDVRSSASGRKIIDRSRIVDADIDAVWRLVGDRSTWTTWSPLGTYELVHPGQDGPNSVGSVCVFRTGRNTAREEIVEYVPRRRISYSLLAGLPLVGYRADVDVRPVGGGTEVRWHSEFRPAHRLTGGIYRAVLDRFIGRMLDGLVTYLAQQGSSRPAAAEQVS